MLDPTQIGALHTRFPTLGSDAGLSAAIAASAAAASLARGRDICREGENCSHLALVTRGTARVFKLAESGREITLYRVEPGECCILTASCMLSGRPFPANATVESNLEAALLPAPQVIRWMSESAAWRHFLWNLLAERLGDVIGLVEEVAFRRMDRRPAEYLAQHVLNGGKTLQATHQQIAADLGTSREVISRMLKDFELRGLLRLSRGRIELGTAAALQAVGRERD